MTQSDIPDDPDFRAAVARMQADADELRERSERMQEALQQAEGEASSPDGAVTVKVGASGALTDLQFDSRAYRRPPEALSALVLQLIGQAQRDASAQLTEAVTELVGANSPALELFREFVPEGADEEDLPEDEPAAEAEAEPEAPPPASPRRPKSDEDDEDFENPW